MLEKLKSEKGAAMIIEATIVFPIMFLIIFMMITVGNAYMQKCRVESVVVQMAYYGAAQCADPLVKQVAEQGKVPKASREHEVLPYRYIGKSGEMQKIVDDVDLQIREKVEKMKSGFFGGMEPEVEDLDVNFNNAYVYSTFTVGISYKVKIPVRLIGMDDWFSIKFSSRLNVPVSDTPEFIRNVAMIEDWITSSETGSKFIDKINEALDKVEPFLDVIN